MTECEAGANAGEPSRVRNVKKLLWLVLLLVLGLTLALTILVLTSKASGPLARLALADGRILQVEGVTYGTLHRIGQKSILLDRFGPWLPQRLRSWLAPRTPDNTIELERPGLVVWVNAIDPATGTNVDCQGIRAEFVDKHGDLFGETTRNWFGGQSFWRVGQVFYTFPRDERELTLRVTPWKMGKQIPAIAQFPNPHPIPAAIWSGGPLPQTVSVNSLEITLAGLHLRTNQQTYWQTPSVYFEPHWQLRQGAHAARGWTTPEWTAEDPTGNRGQHLCPHWTALRFFASVYPTATNAEAAVVIATLPQVDWVSLTNQVSWNNRTMLGTNEIVALGICPPGVYTFTGGDFDPNGPRLGGVSGGARSGWTSQSQRLTPLKVQIWHGHYTPEPTVYVRANLRDGDRLAVRLREHSGRQWIAKPEPQGNPDGVHAFLIELPAEVSRVVPELVLLKPARAEFLVKTSASR